MAKQIVNRVANSVLKTIDLEELYPKGTRVAFDISNGTLTLYSLIEKKPLLTALKNKQ